MVSVVGFCMVSGCYRTAAVSPMETVKKTPERSQDELSIYIYIVIHTHLTLGCPLVPLEVLHTQAHFADEAVAQVGIQAS